MSPSLAFREERPDGEPRGTLLCVHGFPESSAMWAPLLRDAARAGWHAIAPDLPPAGGSAPDPPHTWTNQVRRLDAFVDEHDLGPVVLCVHDWGGLIGLRWACDRGPGAVRGLVISDTGFFADGTWHGMAQTMRTPGEGEQLVQAFDPATLAQTLRALSPGMGEEELADYVRPFATEAGGAATLELYRSGDFEELGPYQGKLAALGVPALVVWGAEDPFSPVAGAHRFGKELDAEVLVLDGVGHFVFDDAPERTSAAVLAFLDRL
ncbi:alpha/beta fold hydrolase [Conexibacter sp. SYSU D00693]|uniref:alpha/beta fold hydrolase n=1 Tax=Conexibacter sp. SYSU D00693 TaxID=2812560 RepID=UPI00196A2683|nr:alpha/beta fold hydrolase [Conexibacter sp. SYSU D00693]